MVRGRSDVHISFSCSVVPRLSTVEMPQLDMIWDVKAALRLSPQGDESGENNGVAFSAVLAVLGYAARQSKHSIS